MFKDKYDITKFKSVLGMYEDIENFDKAHEDFVNNKITWIGLKTEAERLFFTLKHRRIEGSITPMLEEEMVEHMREVLVNGRF